MTMKIALMGGALREQIVADHLREKGFRIATYAMKDMRSTDVKSAEVCLKDASALILPVRSNDREGLIGGNSSACPVALNEKILNTMGDRAPIYCGIASEELRSMAKKTDHPLYEVMEHDDIAIPNAVLTAEGTLFYVMEQLPVGLRELHIAVFGYGRVGKACAELFSAVGSRVTVFCRHRADWEAGRENGFDIRYYGGTGAILPKVDVLINTVPAIVVTEEIMKQLKLKCHIVDLASYPGGVEPIPKEAYDLFSLMLPGIPGKYAPITAGRILAEYYERELEKQKGGAGS